VLQQVLETTDLAIERVATEAGFGFAAVMREHFAAVVGTSPLSYRRAFSRVDRSASRNERQLLRGEDDAPERR
jgi:transcriptional regulator GlxA family with amidase domain